MSAPVASFAFIATGLSVAFQDRSAGVVNTWNWDFGNGDISVLQNPTEVFATPGSYKVNLTVANADGTSIFSFYLLVQTTPGLNLTIKQQVAYLLPPEISFDEIGFQQATQKWQLYLQNAANIDNDDVFDETKWPPLFNVLISKLIVYDLILKAATSSMTAFLAAAANFNTIKNNIISGTVQVADYTIGFNFAAPFVVNSLIIDGVSHVNPGPIADIPSLLAWMNGLFLGIFILNGTNIQSLGNSHVITTFNVTANGVGHNQAFTQSNVRVVSVTQAVTSGSTSGLFKGPVKSIKAGPSEASWYDGSAFWASIFKSLGSGGLEGGGGGIFGALIEDICLYSKKVGVKMPMCGPQPKSVRPFIIGRGRVQARWDADVCKPGDFPFNLSNWVDQQW